MSLRSRFLALVSLGISALQICAQTPKPPAVLDPALKIEALATYPEVEACATVCGAPDGSFYVGCDTRDASFNTVEPECFIVRYSTMGANRQRTGEEQHRLVGRLHILRQIEMDRHALAAVHGGHADHLMSPMR